MGVIRRPWTRREDAIVRRRYPTQLTAAIARELGRSVGSVYQRAATLGLAKSPAYLAGVQSGRFRGGSVHIGAEYRFPKGHVPANKGVKRGKGWAPGRMREGQFKPGVRQGIAAKNWRPVGTILADSDGYLRIKVREAQPGEAYGFGNVRVWPLLQRHVWTQAHGPIPPGYSVCFRNGDRTDCRLDNLELVSRAELMARNTVHRLPKPLADAYQLIGALTRQIRKRSRDGKEQDRRPA